MNTLVSPSRAVRWCSAVKMLIAPPSWRIWAISFLLRPAVNGSSYGVSCVTSADELPPALELAFEHGDKVLVEQRLVGTEITVGVFWR